MPFITAANNFITNPDQSCHRWREMQETLRFLLAQQIAVSSETVVNQLNGMGFHMVVTSWQQEVLTPLRDRRIFIGSSGRGVFIIRSREDAIDCYRFYAKRIIAEAEHLGILNDLIRVANWDFPQVDVR